jgi:hypothetical protein
MSDTERRYDVEIYPFGSLDLERIPDEKQEGAGEIPLHPGVQPVSFSLDVIQRLIERLQEL